MADEKNVGEGLAAEEAGNVACHVGIVHAVNMRAVSVVAQVKRVYGDAPALSHAPREAAPVLLRPKEPVRDNNGAYACRARSFCGALHRLRDGCAVVVMVAEMVSSGTGPHRRDREMLKVEHDRATRQRGCAGARVALRGCGYGHAAHVHARRHAASMPRGLCGAQWLDQHGWCGEPRLVMSHALLVASHALVVMGRALVVVRTRAVGLARRLASARGSLAT